MHNFTYRSNNFSETNYNKYRTRQRVVVFSSRLSVLVLKACA